MIEMNPLIATIVMISAVVVGILSGFPLSLSIAGVALVIGVLTMGVSALPSVYHALYGVTSNYTFLAVPLFILMGMMMGYSGVADRLFGTLHILMGGLRGGLAMATITLGTAFAACVGNIGASVNMLGLIALPAMINRRYNKEIACGSVCAGGTLGILIPPSVMLVIYGPTAGISVGKLFMGAFIPGFLLSSLYITYIGIFCIIKPGAGPPVLSEQRKVPLIMKLRLFITSIFPILFIIIMVLGSIFFGIAAPTEAAGVGAFASIILTIFYRKLTLVTLKRTLYDTLKISSYIIFVATAASFFTSIFLRLGCGNVVESLILDAPFGRWGAFTVLMLTTFVLGMFIDWIGIIFIIVPMITPVAVALGFDPLWFALMIIINLQLSFLTPPLAYAIIYLRALTTPEMEVEISHIVRGVIPFIGLIIVGLGLCVAFPQLILWLPSVMIR